LIKRYDPWLCPVGCVGHYRVDCEERCFSFLLERLVNVWAYATHKPLSLLTPQHLIPVVQTSSAPSHGEECLSDARIHALYALKTSNDKHN
jgi:hypothetical protein